MKLAILGTGFIVQEGALKALKDVPEIETVAIYALPRSREMALALAKQNSIPKVFITWRISALTVSTHREFWS